MLQNPLQFSHSLLEQTVKNGDTVIDATVGNGHDTLKLASLVQSEGKVYGYDIQEQAIESAKLKLEKAKLTKPIELMLKGHEHISDLPLADSSVSAVVFNLGYLPSGDKSIITTPETTVSAIKSSLPLLKKGGLILLMIYHGHEGGKEEKDAVSDCVSQLPQKEFNVLRYGFINQKNTPPYLIAIEKK